jgi:hypothetical protein
MAKSASIAAKSGKFGTLQGLAAGAVLAAAPSMALLLAVLLAPGLICLIADRAPGRPVARACLLAGFACAISPAWQLWNQGLGFDHAANLLSDVAVPAAAWCAGACAWLAAELAPLGVRLVFDLQAERRKQRLLEIRARLIKEWNLMEDQAVNESDKRQK